MLDLEDRYTRQHILDANFGLEKENLRVLDDGHFAETLHPFPEDDGHIVKDFCENQVEINTSVHTSAAGAVEELVSHTGRINRRLAELEPREYLWPFSNPPYIENERDIPVGHPESNLKSEPGLDETYREYLAEKYGRYKLTLCGIHVNFSFSDDMLRSQFERQKSKPGGETDFRMFKDSVYLDLARKLAEYGWILTAVTAASPLVDSSFVEKGIFGENVFTGMASVRCSELGYWNEFAPILDYSSIEAYADSIRSYVDRGLLQKPAELYYPVRIKPRGENSLERLRETGADHIELRMFDVNPLEEAGVNEMDVRFAHLLAVWLASTACSPFTDRDQVQAVQNFKNAARYDLKTVRIVDSEGGSNAVEAGIRIIEQMKEFYRELDMPVQAVLDFELQKFLDADNRYAWKVRQQYQDGYVSKGLQLAKERQDG